MASDLSNNCRFNANNDSINFLNGLSATCWLTNGVHWLQHGLYGCPTGTKPAKGGSVVVIAIGIRVGTILRMSLNLSSIGISLGLLKGSIFMV